MARNLSPEDLRKPCDPKRFRFSTTSEVAPLTRIVGQVRALDAIDFGLDMHSLGFNIYVLGESGTGRSGRKGITLRGRSIERSWTGSGNSAKR
jgi:AAA domain